MKIIKRPKIIPRKKLEMKAREITDVFSSGQFEGQKCLIVAGGPSLDRIHPKEVTGPFVIGVNKAFIKYNVDLNYSMDCTFYDLVSNQSNTELYRLWKEYKGHKVFLRLNQRYKFDSDILWIRPLGFKAISFVLGKGIYPFNNSAGGATMLAIALGFRKIGLLGVDLCFFGKKTHFHDGYEHQDPRSLERKFLKFKAGWEEFASAFKEEKIEVFNLSGESKLECFPKISLEKFKSE